MDTLLHRDLYGSSLIQREDVSPIVRELDVRLEHINTLYSWIKRTVLIYAMYRCFNVSQVAGQFLDTQD